MRERPKVPATVSTWHSPMPVWWFVLYGAVLLVALLLPSAVRAMRSPPRRPDAQPVGMRLAGEGTPRPTAAAGKAKAVPVLLRLSGLRMGDADTFTANIRLPYGIVWNDRKIRVLGFDAYESSNARRTVEFLPDELERGRRATDYGWQVLNGADAVYVEATEDLETTWDRMLGAIWFDPPGESSELVNYGEHMRARGHARPTDPVLEKQAKGKK